MSAHDETPTDRTVRNTPIDVALQVALEAARDDADCHDRVGELVREAQQFRAGDLE